MAQFLKLATSVMKSWFGLAVIAMYIGLTAFKEGMDERIVTQAYIERFAPLAIEEMHRAGIPASIKLAQALVESNAGRSKLALESNNHFGIKCKAYWTGQSYYHKDDDLDNKGNLVESCFRAYNDIESSFIDHSEFLRFSGKYDRLFTIELTDYKAWANGLKSCGYATDQSYTNKLIQTIETYKLYRFDTFQAKEFDMPSTGNAPRRVVQFTETTID